MSFEIVLMPAMTVIGTELRTTFKNDECYTAQPEFWQQQYNENNIAKIARKLYPDVVLGVYTNYTTDFSLTSGYYSFIIGSPVTTADTIPNGMIITEIPATKYAVFTAKGPFASAIAQTWMEIWQNKDIKRTFTHDFEWYDVQSTNDENSVVKIYIAIK